MITILALDVSSRSTGVCVFTDGYLVETSCAIIKINDKWDLGKKLCFFEQNVNDLITQYAPTDIIVEDIFKGRNIKTFKSLARFQGVAFKTIYGRMGKDPFCLTAIKARGMLELTSSKEEAFKYIKRKYPQMKFEFEEDNDITDAIVLALAAEILMGKKTRKRKKRTLQKPKTAAATSTTTKKKRKKK